MILSNVALRDSQDDSPKPRPQIDVAREKRHSPRSPEEVDLALAAVKEIYKFIDGVEDDSALHIAERYFLKIYSLVYLHTLEVSSAHEPYQPLRNDERQ